MNYLEQALHKSQLCNRLAHSITTSRIYGLSIEQIVDSSLKQIHSAFPNYRVAYSTIDSQGKLTVIQSLEPEGMPPLTGLRADLSMAPEYLAALRQGEPLIIEDVANASIIEPLAEAMSARGTKAVLDVPVKPCRHLVGLLCLDSAQPYCWSEHEIGAMIEIADYFSYALQEIHAEQERRDSEAALHQANCDLRQYAKQLEKANQELEITLEELYQANEELIATRQQTVQQRQRYQDLFNLAPDGYLVTDTWGVIQEANQAARGLFGASEDSQILGKSLVRFIPVQERRVFRNQLNQLRMLHQPTPFEINVQPRQGMMFSAAITVTAIENWQDERVKFLWLIRDISDKKRAEFALQQLNQELEERVRQRTADLNEAIVQLKMEIAERLQLSAERSRLITILEASADCIGIYDNQGNILWNNPQLNKIRGLNSDADVTPLKIADYHPQWAFNIIQQQGLPTAIRDGVWVGETALLDENNHEISMSQMIIAHKSVYGTVDYFSTVMRDTSDKKQAEQHIRFQAGLLDAVEQAVIATDLRGNITYWNRFAEILYGWSAAEVLGCPIVEVTPTETSRDTAIEIMSRLQAGESWSGEFLVQRRDGETFPIMITDSPIYDEQGVLSGIVGISMDMTKLKQAEEKLRETQQHLQAILDYSPTAIYVIDQNNNHLLVSHSYETLVSATQESLIGKSIYEVWPSEFCDAFAVNNQQVIQSGKPIEIEEVAPHADGVHTYITIKFPLYDADGEPYAVCGISADISDRKRAEKELRTSQRLIQKIADSSPNLLYLYDLEEQRNVYVNREITQILGYTPEEIQAMGQTFLSGLMHPDDWSVSPEKFKQLNAADDGEVIEFEYRMRHKNGEWRWLYSWDTVFLRTPEGKPKQILGSATDISDRKRLELALQQSEERFRTCVENLLDPLALFSSIRDTTGQILDFRFEYINPAGCRANRKSREETLGRTLCEILPAHRETGIFDAYCRVVKTGESLIQEAVLFEDVFGGTQMQRFFDFQAIKFGDGFVVTWRDVTERKQAEAQIQASLKEKEVLLREIHHRVKNNLQVIHSLLRLQSAYMNDPKIIEMFHESQTRIRSMALVHELLYQSQDLARINFGSYIHTLVNQLARTYTISSSALCWDINVEPTDIQIGIDTALPCGLLINELVSNTLKYAFPQGQPGQIQISLRACNNEEFILAISDNGVGIPADLDFRNTASLGLQLVCGAVEQIRGTIELDQTQGTTFIIRFKDVKYKPRR